MPDRAVIPKSAVAVDSQSPEHKELSTDLEIEFEQLVELVVINWTDKAAQLMASLRNDMPKTQSTINELFFDLEKELHAILDVLFPKYPIEHPKRAHAYRHFMNLVVELAHRRDFDKQGHPIFEDNTLEANQTYMDIGTVAISDN